MRAIFVLGLAACTGHGSQDLETYDLDPHLTVCSGFGPFLCLSGTDETGEHIELFEAIEGFEFRWGESHRVTVSSHDIPNPPADGSSIRLELEDEELIGTAAPTDTFALDFHGFEGSLLSEGDTSDRVVLSNVELACEPAICASVIGRMDDFALDLVFDAPAGTVATIQQVR